MAAAFNPSEEDLIRYLQLRTRHGRNHPGCPPSQLLPDVDVYGDLNPWEMFDKTVVGHWFFAFARLKLRGPTRFHRGVGRGSWAMKSTQKAGDGEGSIMKRFFIYEERADVASPAEGGDDDDDGHWSMQEFSLAGAKDNDYVICRVKKRPKH